MDEGKLSKVLRLHALWLRHEKGGVRADLSGADLYGADLSGADLQRATLCGANLCAVDLRGADLRGAAIDDAVLCGAVLGSADLRGADLTDSNLGGASLYGAYLNGATLHGVNLRGAVSPAGSAATPLVIRAAKYGACVDGILWLWELDSAVTYEQAFAVARRDWREWALEYMPKGEEE